MSNALVGIDLVELGDVRWSIATHGRRYLERIYTERELRESAQAPARLAGAMAAKEATMKLLRSGDESLPWRSIALHDDRPVPTLELTGAAAELAQARSIVSLSVSLSRVRDSVCAVVLAELRSP